MQKGSRVQPSGSYEYIIWRAVSVDSDRMEHRSRLAHPFGQFSCVRMRHHTRPRISQPNSKQKFPPASLPPGYFSSEKPLTSNLFFNSDACSNSFLSILRRRRKIHLQDKNSAPFSSLFLTSYSNFSPIVNCFNFVANRFADKWDLKQSFFFGFVQGVWGVFCSGFSGFCSA